MRLVHNERLKLTAGALNTAATSCFTVGIATPLAGYLYNIGGLRSALGIAELAIGLTGWRLAAVSPTFGGEIRAQGVAAMNSYFILAFIVTPAVVAGLGWLTAFWAVRKAREPHAPAE